MLEAKWHIRALVTEKYPSQLSQKKSPIDRARSIRHFKSPSDTLIAALEERGYGSVTPTKRTKKLDLTRISPFPSQLRRRKRPLPTFKRVRKIVYAVRATASPKALRRRLQWILSRFLLLLTPRGDGRGSADILSYSVDYSILRVFNDEVIAFLASKGYDASDVLVWAWIVTAKTSEQAALRLVLVSQQKSCLPLGFETKRIPAFLFLFLLRRSDVTASALRLFIDHAWHRLGSKTTSHDALLSRHNVDTGVPIQFKSANEVKVPPQVISKYLKMSEPTIVTMVIRLLRHARKLWPAALVSISTLVTTHLNGEQPGHFLNEPSALDEKVSARLSFLYNKLLHLLALPSSQHPYRAIPYHQRAQFKLISRMNEFEPPLTINREGYHAVVRIQLAHRKTPQEREWAGMKAKTWPPWKTDKLGIDAAIGIDSGVSRAKESLSRLAESGYGFQSWEAAASILSGWDTDQSPTIQTRTIYKRSSIRTPNSDSDKVQDQIETDGNVWAARIRCTRTIYEAWACFLAYKDQHVAPFLAVYSAMFERLVFDAKRHFREAKMKSVDSSYLESISALQLSGEGREVSRPPSDPRERIYVRTPPPTVNDFFRMMLTDGIKPSRRSLAFMLGHAASMRDGVGYLKSSSLPPPVVSLLLGEEPLNSPEKEKSLKQLPDYLFAAHIGFLCRFNLGREYEPTDAPSASFTNHKPLRNRLRLASSLMDACKPSYRPPWYSLLKAIIKISKKNSNKPFLRNGIIEETAIWNAILRLLDRMSDAGVELDFAGFQTICIGFEKTIQAGQRSLVDSCNITSDHDANVQKKYRLIADNIVSSGLTKLKALFRGIVDFQSGEDDTLMDDTKKEAGRLKLHGNVHQSMLLPNLLEVPSPADLHAFIRALGLGQDRNGLYALVRWMACYASDLKALADELRNGPKLTRRCLVATRAFLDGSWHDLVGIEGLQGEDAPIQVDESLVENARAVIEGVEEWDGWPTDEEVEDYCTKGRSSWRSATR
ncbi:hypothetical protein MMC13_005745 [Lambiella insularis]|nr:hypothetical protein [Lambiella insularis]